MEITQPREIFRIEKYLEYSGSDLDGVQHYIPLGVYLTQTKTAIND